jgi:hypothetical protein
MWTGVVLDPHMYARWNLVVPHMYLRCWVRKYQIVRLLVALRPYSGCNNDEWLERHDNSASGSDVVITSS